MLEIQQTPGTENLYSLYLQFINDMSGVPISQEEFAVWFSDLDVGARDMCIRDFRMGYAAVLAETEGQMAKVISEHNEVLARE